MAIDNIPINGGSPMGAQLKGLRVSLWGLRGLAEQTLAEMNEMWAGSDYTQLETQFGIPTGQGSTVYSLVFALANGNPASPSGFGAGAFTQFMSRLN